tara:strand:+ start:7167 stop:8786 length:1620 start_codon:yes stop_codon:yes gene_type:complete
MTLRLEYAVTGKDISESLSCRLADPLWMIARQWQVGEFDGEDAGSAILARVSTEWLPLDEAGPPGHAAPLSGSAVEAVVEAESEAVREDGIAYSIEVGTRLLRRLSLNGLADVRQKLCERFPFSQGALDLPSEEDEEVLLAARNGIDGYLVYRYAMQGGGWRELLGDLTLTRAQQRVFSRIVDEWTVACQTKFEASGAAQRDCWSVEALRYEAELSARSGNAKARLTSDDHVGGRLSWYAFDLADAPSANGRDGRQTSVLATPGTFRGMPKPRWWEFEDSEVSFADLEGGEDEVAASLVTAFATVHSDDWMVVPVNVANNSLAHLSAVQVQDSFGEWHEIPALGGRDPAPRVWRFFEQTSTAGEKSQEPWLLLLSGVAATEGPVLEQVDFVRDEGANLCWGIERIVQSPLVYPLNRSKTVIPESEEEDWTYRLRADVPMGWIPLVPQGEGTSFRRGRMAAWESPSDGAIGAILEPWKATEINGSAIPDGGVRVTRRYQRVRTLDGGVKVWLGRDVRHGISPPRSFLRYDRLKVPGSSDP